MRLSGVLPMLPTPFNAAGDIIWDDFAPLITDQFENGAEAIAALGLGGEASRLSPAERRRVAETVLSAVPTGTPVVIGVSADDTATACALAAEAAAMGAAAIMAAPPNVVGISRTALRDHYLAVCDAAAAIEVMVQDAPAFLPISLGGEFVAELARARGNIRYAKSEAFPAAERTEELHRLLGTQVGVFGGGSGLHLLDVLDAGAVGVIPGCEATAQFVRIHAALVGGAREQAARYFGSLLPLLVFETQTLDIFIASSKAILKARGIIRSDALRAADPLGPWSRRVLAHHAQTALQLSGDSVERLSRGKHAKAPD